MKVNLPVSSIHITSIEWSRKLYHLAIFSGEETSEPIYIAVDERYLLELLALLGYDEENYDHRLEYNSTIFPQNAFREEKINGATHN